MYKDLLHLIADNINDRQTFYNFSRCNKMCQKISKDIYLTKKIKYDHPKNMLYGNAMIGSFSCKYVPNDNTGNIYLIDIDKHGVMNFVPRHDGYSTTTWDGRNNKPKIPNEFQYYKPKIPKIPNSLIVHQYYKK
jgi:hypothetical protein